MKNKKLKKRLIKLLLLIAILLIFIYVYYFLFLNYNIVIPCFFHKITGWYCPGCGITRMFSSLAQFDFYQAFRYNPLLFISLPFVFICIIDITVHWLLDKNTWFFHKLSNKFWIVLLVVVLIYGVLRNVPYFDYLIPTVI